MKRLFKSALFYHLLYSKHMMNTINTAHETLSGMFCKSLDASKKLSHQGASITSLKTRRRRRHCGRGTLHFAFAGFLSALQQLHKPNTCLPTPTKHMCSKFLFTHEAFSKTCLFTVTFFFSKLHRCHCTLSKASVFRSWWYNAHRMCLCVSVCACVCLCVKGEKLNGPWMLQRSFCGDCFNIQGLHNGK